jgi:glucose-6-phosphate 1-dehydrogenase
MAAIETATPAPVLTVAMVDIDRVEMDSETYRQTLSKDIASYVGDGFNQDSWDTNISKAYYMPGDFRNADSYQQLKSFLLQVDHEQGTAGNYLLAVMSVVAMESPNSFEAEAIRNEQIKALKAIQSFDSEKVLTDTVSGQYGEGAYKKIVRTCLPLAMNLVLLMIRVPKPSLP